MRSGTCTRSTGLAANKLPLELTDDLCDRLKNVYLQTDLGKLDCLGEVSGVGNYEQVLQRSITHQTSYGEFRILSLEALIASKVACLAAKRICLP